MAFLLGLDLGEKRVGVALAEEELRTATPLVTLEITGRKMLLAELRKLVEEYRVEKIVVGLPRTLKGEIGPSAQRIVEQVDWLKTHLECTWFFWDERLSTQEVERVLLAAEVHARVRKKVRDQLAAQRILQSYLDSPK